MTNVKLCDLIDDTLTDKNTYHSYLDTYETLFASKKDTVKMVLEVGIQAGGSIKLWLDYFTNATIYGIDVNALESKVPSILVDNPSVKLYNNIDAYNSGFVMDTFVNMGINFDILIDDGPHTLISMVHFIMRYLPLLKDDGILVIEDIPEYEWINILTEAVPVELRKFIQVFDLRKNKNRYDDIMFVINLTLG